MAHSEDIVLRHIANVDLHEYPRKPVAVRLFLDLMHILYENKANMPVVTRAVSRFLDVYSFYIIDAYATNVGISRHDTQLAVWDIPDINFLEQVNWKRCYSPTCDSEEVHTCYWHRACGNLGCKEHMTVVERPDQLGVNKYVHLCGTCVLICEIFSLDMISHGVKNDTRNTT